MPKGGGRHEGGKKSSQGGRGSETSASPAAISRYLKGIDFPCGKDDLIEQAQNNDAPEDVLHVLEQFEDREYDSVADVAEEVGKIE